MLSLSLSYALERAKISRRCVRPQQTSVATARPRGSRTAEDAGLKATAAIAKTGGFQLRYRRYPLAFAADRLLAFRRSLHSPIRLATGSKRESTLRFYEGAGFTRDATTYFEIRRP